MYTNVHKCVNFKFIFAILVKLWDTINNYFPYLYFLLIAENLSVNKVLQKHSVHNVNKHRTSVNTSSW